MESGRPQKQALAIAYRMAKKRARGGMVDHGECMAKGGFVREEEESGYHHMPKDHEKMDERALMEDDRMLKEHGYEEGPEAHMRDGEGLHERHYGHKEENQDLHDEDMVDKVMRKHMSKGGRVADATGMGYAADCEPNEFDDLVKDDELEGHYPGSQEHGDHAEDEERDLVLKAMKKRFSAHNPRPA